MKTIRFRTLVDPDVDYPQDKFREEVTIYLNDPYGWAQFYEFVYASSGPAKLMRLCRPHTLKQEGCRDDALSCAVLGGNIVWLNYDRWMRGSKASRLSLEDYRQYMVSHEMGHSLGYEHTTCPGPGQPVPVMMQQTLGIGECVPNTKVTEKDLQSSNVVYRHSSRRSILGGP